MWKGSTTFTFIYSVTKINRLLYVLHTFCIFSLILTLILAFLLYENVMLMLSNTLLSWLFRKAFFTQILYFAQFTFWITLYILFFFYVVYFKRKHTMYKAKVTSLMIYSKVNKPIQLLARIRIRHLQHPKLYSLIVLSNHHSILALCGDHYTDLENHRLYKI